MRELSVRCDALTRAGVRCRRPAYEPMVVGDVRVWLCTQHERMWLAVEGPVSVVLDGAGNVVSDPVRTNEG